MRQIRRKQNRRSIWGFLALSAALICWLARPGLVTGSAREGLELCAGVMIPSLFPFFVMSNLFIRRNYHQYVTSALRPLMGPLFGLSGSAAGALALGAVGGYPIGAATAFRLYDRGELSAGQTSRLLMFCNNAGPGFIFGVVGMGLLGSVRAGALLYGIHLLSAVLIGAAIHAFADRPQVAPAAGGAAASAAEPPAESFPVSFVESVREAAEAMLNVCAFLVFFSVILSFLRTSFLWNGACRGLHAAFGIQPSVTDALLDGTMELSTGISCLKQAGGTESAQMVCSLLLLGWGGLCVHCQVLSLRGGRSVPMGPYFAGKAAQAVVSVLVLLLFRLQPILGAAICLLFLFGCASASRKKSAGKTAAYHV